MFSLDRRSLVIGGVATGASGLLKSANAASNTSPKPEGPRGTEGIFVRLPDVDLESGHDFLSGYIGWRSTEFAQVYRARAAEIFKGAGIEADKPTNLPTSKILALIANDPIIALNGRLSLDTQYTGHAALRDAFHGRADFYLSELDAAEKVGPGHLELNRTIEVPDYCRHEIHTQIGGYVGDPLAGHIYVHSFQKLLYGHVKQDQNFDAIAAACPVPEDGKVKRILDNGTGCGQLAAAMKRRFPEAEVWGIDIAAPMIRYAHMRANSRGVAVNYAQRLTESNGFPDNYFDIVISTSFHHELPIEKSQATFREVHRTLRKGGVYRPAESGIDGYGETPMNKFSTYMNYRWNNEVWIMDWSEMDRFGSIEAAGLKLNREGAKRGTGVNWIPGAVARKV